VAERPSLSCSHKLPGRNSASSKRSRREAAAAPGSGRCPRSSVSRQQQAGRASSAAAAFPAPTSTRRAQRCRTAQPSARACPGLDLIPGCFSSQGLTREPPAHSSPQGGTRAGAAGRAEVTAGQLPSQRQHRQEERDAPRSRPTGPPSPCSHRQGPGLPPRRARTRALVQAPERSPAERHGGRGSTAQHCPPPATAPTAPTRRVPRAANHLVPLQGRSANQRALCGAGAVCLWVGGQPGAAGRYACAGRNVLGGAGPAGRGEPGFAHARGGTCG